MKFTKEDIGKTVVVNANQVLYSCMKGVICMESHGELGTEWIGIEVGVDEGVHNCQGHCSDGRGLFVYAEDFEIKGGDEVS